MASDTPRILITAPKSGAGKTMITCGILQAFKERRLKVTAYKCGPDYIDPMFHKEVLGIESYNLDTFLCGRDNVRNILIKHSERYKAANDTKTDDSIAVIEGVMGYYDGLGGISTEASAYDVASATDTPAILVVDCKGASVSIVPSIQGFLKYKEDEAKNSHIAGVILNRLSPMMYERMKEFIERETSVKVYGYVPVIEDFVLESRHLGLKMPGEIENIQKKLIELGRKFEETLDIDGLVQLALSASHLKKQYDNPSVIEINGKLEQLKTEEGSDKYNGLRIGVASDEAFCFIYQDNLELLAEMGAEIVPFSPIHDTHLPEKLNGLIFYGGYPELYAGMLSKNVSMKEEVKKMIERGFPCIAECGGFQYLQESIRDEKGDTYPMCGVLKGQSFHTPSLRRFGYVTLSNGAVFGKEVGQIFAHEFHYYDSEYCGEDFEAKKPLSNRSWKCMISTDSIFAGYPHIHYVGNRKVAEAFLAACEKYKNNLK